MKTLKEIFAFTEWAGQHYNRLPDYDREHGCWVHKYRDKNDRRDHRTTKEIYDFYKLIKKEYGSLDRM